MKKNIEILSSSSLFSGIQREDIHSMLDCLGARERVFVKEEFLYHVGDIPAEVGVVLRGRVQVIREDFLGNRNILAEMGEGDLFAEAYACAGNRPMNVSVYAASGGEALMLDCRRIVTTCPTSCAFHARLIQNLLSVVARKNIQLSGKMEHLSRRTTREKLLSYFSERSEQAGSLTFEIPFNRQELSDFLCVERSAMSAELSRMKRDGLLSYQKNRFTLHMPGEDMGRER